MMKTDIEYRQATAAKCNSELSNEQSDFYDCNNSSIDSDYYHSNSQSYDSQFNDLDNANAIRPLRKLRTNGKNQQQESGLSKASVKEEEQEPSSQPSLSALSSSSRLRSYSSFSHFPSSRSLASLRNSQKSLSNTLDASCSSCGCATSCSCRSSSHRESSAYSSSTDKSTCLSSLQNRNQPIDEHDQKCVNSSIAYLKLAEELGLPPLIHLQWSQKQSNTINAHHDYTGTRDNKCKDVEKQEQWKANMPNNTISNKTVLDNKMTKKEECAAQEISRKNDSNIEMNKAVNNGNNKLLIESKRHTTTVKESSTQTECESTTDPIFVNATRITLPMTNAFGVSIAEEMLVTKKEMANLLLELFMQFSQDMRKEMESSLQKNVLEYSSQTEKRYKAHCISRAVSPIRPVPIKIYHCAVQTTMDNSNKEVKKRYVEILLSSVSNEEFYERYDVITHMEGEARKNLETLIQESCSFIKSAEREYRRIEYEQQSRNTFSHAMEKMLFNVISEEFSNRKELELNEYTAFTTNIEHAERNAAHELNLAEVKQRYRDELDAKEQQLQDVQFKLSQMQEELTKAAVRERELTKKYITMLKLPTINVNNVTGQATKRINRCDDSNCVETLRDDLPIHRRFARAHQEAIKVVTAQRQTCLS